MDGVPLGDRLDQAGGDGAAGVPLGAFWTKLEVLEQLVFPLGTVWTKVEVMEQLVWVVSPWGTI